MLLRPAARAAGAGLRQLPEFASACEIIGSGRPDRFTAALNPVHRALEVCESMREPSMHILALEASAQLHGATGDLKAEARVRANQRSLAAAAPDQPELTELASHGLALLALRSRRGKPLQEAFGTASLLERSRSVMAGSWNVWGSFQLHRTVLALLEAEDATQIHLDSAIATMHEATGPEDIPAARDALLELALLRADFLSVVVREGESALAALAPLEAAAHAEAAGDDGAADDGSGDDGDDGASPPLSPPLMPSRWLPRTHPFRVLLSRAQGRAHFLVGDLDLAEDHFAAALRLEKANCVDAAAPGANVSRCLLELARLFAYRGDAVTAEGLYRSAIDQLESEGSADTGTLGARRTLRDALLEFSELCGRLTMNGKPRTTETERLRERAAALPALPHARAVDAPAETEPLRAVPPLATEWYCARHEWQWWSS